MPRRILLRCGILLAQHWLTKKALRLTLRSATAACVPAGHHRCTSRLLALACRLPGWRTDLSFTSRRPGMLTAQGLLIINNTGVRAVRREEVRMRPAHDPTDDDETSILRGVCWVMPLAIFFFPMLIARRLCSAVSRIAHSAVAAGAHRDFVESRYCEAGHCWWFFSQVPLARYAQIPIRGWILINTGRHDNYVPHLAAARERQHKFWCGAFPGSRARYRLRNRPPLNLLSSPSFPFK
jgi:hypothetical protein